MKRKLVSSIAQHGDVDESASKQASVACHGDGSSSSSDALVTLTGLDVKVFTCDSCRETKPGTEFYRDRYTRCKSCRSKWTRINLHARQSKVCDRLRSWKASFPEDHVALFEAFFSVVTDNKNADFSWNTFFARYEKTPDSRTGTTASGSARALKRRHTI